MLISPGWVITHLKRLWVILIPLSLLTIYFVTKPQSLPLPSLSTIQHPVNFYHSATASKKDTFVAAFLENEIDGPFDSTALMRLCNARQWQPGLIFKCEAAVGGVGNVRNIFLNCLRYAIEAGATGFVLPTLMTRTKKDPLPMDHFFDSAYFTQQLSTACPEMRVYNSVNDLWEMPSTSPPYIISPEKFGGPYIHNSVMTNPLNWHVRFTTYVEKAHPVKYSAAAPILVSLKSPMLLQWPLVYDPPAFSASFGRLLRFREDLRRLAGTVLWAMSEQFELHLDPAAGIQPGMFYGAHLRTAKDAQAAGWTPYEVQSKNYIEHADQFRIPLIYLTAGNPEDLIKFARDAKMKQIAVTTKEQLLAGNAYAEERRMLKSLGWDLRGVVDWEVLLWGSQFGGTWESSFSWGVGMRRHVVDGKGIWKVDGPEREKNSILGAKAGQELWRRRQKRDVGMVKDVKEEKGSETVKEKAAVSNSRADEKSNSVKVSTKPVESTEDRKEGKSVVSSGNKPSQADNKDLDDDVEALDDEDDSPSEEEDSKPKTPAAKQDPKPNTASSKQSEVKQDKEEKVEPAPKKTEAKVEESEDKKPATKVEIESKPKPNPESKPAEGDAKEKSKDEKVVGDKSADKDVFVKGEEKSTVKAADKTEVKSEGGQSKGKEDEKTTAKGAGETEGKSDGKSTEQAKGKDEEKSTSKGTEKSEEKPTVKGTDKSEVKTEVKSEEPTKPKAESKPTESKPKEQLSTPIQQPKTNKEDQAKAKEAAAQIKSAEALAKAKTDAQGETLQAAAEGDSLVDGLSIIFGDRRGGDMFFGGMWP